MSTMTTNPTITLHGKTYHLPPPTQPVVVICIDGFDPSYLDASINGTAAPLPNLSSFPFRAKSTNNTGGQNDARAAMPTFTNPNNVSIITGQPTSVHGISGNYYLDGETGEERMVLDDSTLKGSTILAEMANKKAADGEKKQRWKVAAITAKDKLRRILQHGLPLSASPSPSPDWEEDQDLSTSLCLSAQNASDELVQWVGSGRQTRPEQYSGDLSLFVLDAGLRVLRERRAEVLYLTLSDYVQHKYPPGAPEADAFMTAVDSRIGDMLQLGAVVAVTGDHGMSDKCDDDDDDEEDGGKNPNIVFVQDELEKKFGEGCCRVICPITDPFVRHHGALGGFVRVHITTAAAAGQKEEEEEEEEGLVDKMVEFCRGLEHVEEAWPREEAARRYETPAQLEGDLTVVSKGNAVLGSKASEHDLSHVNDHRLRSHGGLSEERVPLLMSVPFVSKREGDEQRDWRNFDIFDLVLNHSR